MAARATAVALLAVLLAFPFRASPVSPVGEYQLKAAFLYNFARFIDWPVRGRANPGDLNLCILGDSPFGPDIDLINGRTVGQATVRLRRVLIDGVGSCQLLFIASSESSHLERDVVRLRGLPILSVGDSTGFSERGIAINFYIEQSKVRFEINIDAVQRSGLTISSQLLKLARITHDAVGSHG
jgi:hypothetical protein